MRPSASINRRQLVRRHNPVLTSAHPSDAFTVGNGDFAVTVDITGLQTIPAFHELVPDPHRVPREGFDELPEQPARPFDRDAFQVPLRTQSTWGWYATRPDREIRAEDAETFYETARGPVPYLDRMGLQRPADPIDEQYVAGAWLHFNPRRLHLGRLALVRVDGTIVMTDEIEKPRTELDLWAGEINARFTLDGTEVLVTTTVHPSTATVATRVQSSLLLDGWGVAWVLDGQRDDLASFEAPLDAVTGWSVREPQRWVGHRKVESTVYGMRVTTTGELTALTDGVLATSADAWIEVVVALADQRATISAPESFPVVREASAHWWQEHWQRGAAVSFEGSSDDRALELERRIVLSQYLLAVNSAGAAPPAETGLTYNTWSGNFHLEMHWWHAAHFPLWGRGDLLERSLEFYHGALEAARSTAQRQGYRGARWPKQTDPSARESPSSIGVFLVWQQPHIIHLLELLRLEGRDERFIEQHYSLVEATADFMADFAEERNGVFVLPPPLIPAQESYLADRATVTNPTFEIAYWAWGLRVANEWRARLGIPTDDRWDLVARNMAAPALLEDGTYAAIATAPHLIRKDHPSMLMALGWLPDTGTVEPSAMGATLAGVFEQWDLQSSWGWDFPVMAMTAAHLGDVDFALDALLWPSPKNRFLTNGHNPQMPGFLTLYLPANGGLLAAIAHITAAIEAGADLPDGWQMTSEGLHVVQRMRASAAAAR